MKDLMSQLWSGRRDLVLVGLMIGILLVLFTPIPSPFLDVLLVINITLALLILLATFFTETPSSSRPSRPSCCWRRCSGWR